MATKVLFDYESREYGYYRFIIKESASSFIVIEQTNQSGSCDKEIRYRKTARLEKDINELVSSDEENVQQAISIFRHYWAESHENSSYWQSWKKVS